MSSSSANLCIPCSQTILFCPRDPPRVVGGTVITTQSLPRPAPRLEPRRVLTASSPAGFPLPDLGMAGLLLGFALAPVNGSTRWEMEW